MATLACVTSIGYFHIFPRLAEIFENVRLLYFVRPVVEQDIPFFMREDVAGARVVVLAAMHPKCRGHVWKEAVVFRELRCVHVYGLSGHAHQVHRVLEYTTDCRWCYGEMQPVRDRGPTATHAARKPTGRKSDRVNFIVLCYIKNN